MPSEQDPFPPYEKPEEQGLPRDRVVGYLLRLQALGQQVRVDATRFVLPIVSGEITVTPVGGRWRVAKEVLRVLSTYGEAATEAELDHLLRMASGASGQWPGSPRSGRLSAKKPASNLRTISTLVGGGEVRAVFDPYLDNRALATLIDILSFGSGTFATRVRLLGSEKTLRTSPGRPPRFTRAGVEAWAAELGISAEGRVLPAGDEHRRFLLLDQGRSLLLGPSLNSLHKNEAVTIEADQEDSAFFEAQWAKAAVLE
jgi:hypothetical protein